MIRKYHNHKLQTTPWHRQEEPLNHHKTPGRQIKQSNQLSLPHQDVPLFLCTSNNLRPKRNYTIFLPNEIRLSTKRILQTFCRMHNLQLLFSRRQKTTEIKKTQIFILMFLGKRVKILRRENSPFYSI